MTKEEHLLTVLIEEGSEVIKEACKALRFGTGDIAPGGDESNVEKLEIEFIELLAVHDMLVQDGVLIIPRNASEIYNNKMTRVKKYMNYAKKKGSINEKFE